MHHEKTTHSDARVSERTTKRKGLGKTVLLARLFSKVAVSLSRLVTIVLLPVSAIRDIMTFRK